MGGLDVQRLALNMSQVEEFSPPPNPAKITDSRAASYISIYGGESWELDALDPDTLAGLVTDAIESIREESEWEFAVEKEAEQRATLRAVSDHFTDVHKYATRRGWIVKEGNGQGPTS